MAPKTAAGLKVNNEWLLKRTIVNNAISSSFGIICKRIGCSSAAAETVSDVPAAEHPKALDNHQQ